MKRAVFIDKDGTLVNDVPYNVDISKITFLPGAMKCLRKLQSAGYELFIISNQAGLHYGYFSEEDLKKAFDFISRTLLKNHILLTDIYYCPHTPAEVPSCNCRKPHPGLLLRAKEAHEIDLDKSWMIGDILNDVEAGNRAGCKTILLDNENETEWVMNEHRKPDFVVKNWNEIEQVILNMPPLSLQMFNDDRLETL